MVRKIIRIDGDKCDGCGLCVTACHEGAIGMVDGKAQLLREDYCDGLGDCLPACPTGAITFEEREAAEYNEVGARAGQEAVRANQDEAQPETLACGCPGTHSKSLEREKPETAAPQAATVPTHLNQWPIQIKLAPPRAPYFQDAHLLVAADCAAYAYGNFHAAYMKNRITLIGCPKLDAGDYAEKLTEILKQNSIKSVTIARMEVPCCGGIVEDVKAALGGCGKMIPWQIVKISTDGQILAD